MLYEQDIKFKPILLIKLPIFPLHWSTLTAIYEEN